MDRDWGGWVAEEEFGGEAADCDISAADGVKDGGVGRGTKGAGDIGDEGSFEITDGKDGGVDGESRARRGRSVYVGKVGTSVRDYRGVERGRGWYVESPHILAGSFRANKNGCRVSRGNDENCGWGKETRARGLQERGNGEERE
jgi:hypothetical protein